jgi:hypothetical protein
VNHVDADDRIRALNGPKGQPTRPEQWRVGRCARRLIPPKRRCFPLRVHPDRLAET